MLAQRLIQEPVELALPGRHRQELQERSVGLGARHTPKPTSRLGARYYMMAKRTTKTRLSKKRPLRSDRQQSEAPGWRTRHLLRTSPAWKHFKVSPEGAALPGMLVELAS